MNVQYSAHVQLITHRSGVCLPTHLPPKLTQERTPPEQGVLNMVHVGHVDRILNQILAFVVDFFRGIGSKFFAVSNNGEHVGFSLFQTGVTLKPTMTSHHDYFRVLLTLVVIALILVFRQSLITSQGATCTV